MYENNKLLHLRRNKNTNRAPKLRAEAIELHRFQLKNNPMRSNELTYSRFSKIWLKVNIGFFCSNTFSSFFLISHSDCSLLTLDTNCWCDWWSQLFSLIFPCQAFNHFWHNSRFNGRGCRKKYYELLYFACGSILRKNRHFSISSWHSQICSEHNENCWHSLFNETQ